jgi:hypothetical protein
MNYLSASQITKLHFPNEKKARRRLRLLHNAGYLIRFGRPNLEAVGRGEYVYYLSSQGAEEIREEKIPKRRPKGLATIEHLLLLNDFRISLELACRGSQFSTAFIAEYDKRDERARTFEKRTTDWVVIPETKERVRFTPDGVFSIANTEGKNVLFFLEIDRGSENLRSSGSNKGFAERIAVYKRYMDSNGYSRYGEDFNYEFKGFRLLIVTSTQHRLEELKRIASEADSRGFVWLTVQQNITPETLFGPIWQVASTEDKELRSIVSRETAKVGHWVERWSEHYAPAGMAKS